MRRVRGRLRWYPELRSGQRGCALRRVRDHERPAKKVSWLTVCLAEPPGSQLDAPRESAENIRVFGSALSVATLLRACRRRQTNLKRCIDWIESGDHEF